MREYRICRVSIFEQKISHCYASFTNSRGHSQWTANEVASQSTATILRTPPFYQTSLLTREGNTSLYINLQI